MSDPSEHGKEFRSTFLAMRPETQYLTDEERFIFALPKPTHQFNVIGVGMIGVEHIFATLLEGRAIIRGIYDIDAQSIGAAQAMVKSKFPRLELVVFSSLEEASMDPEADGLIICTPNFTHIEILRVAVKSGKHILMEKPMATNIPDAHEMLGLTRAYPGVFQIGLQYRYKAMYTEAIHEALQRKTLGEIKMIQIVEHRVPFLDKKQQWNKFKEFSGDTLVEKCCHYFDLMNMFAQAAPKSVFASGSMAVNFKKFGFRGKKSDILDNAFVIVEYENGIRASFALCMFSPQFYEEIVICGDAGRLRAFENQDFLETTGPKTQLEVFRGEQAPSRVTQPVYPSYIQGIGHNGATYYEHKYFVDSIEGQPTTVASPLEGFWAIVVGYAAQESIKTGIPVQIADLLRQNGISEL